MDQPASPSPTTKALQLILDGFLRALSEPNVADTVVKSLSEKVQQERCCPINVTDASELEACPLTVLSFECLRLGGCVSEDFNEDAVKLVEMFRNPYLISFMNISRAVTSTLEYQEVLDTITTEVTKVFNAKACTVMLLDQEANRLDLAASHGLSSKYLEKGPVDAGRSLKGSLDGDPVIIQDVTDSELMQYPDEAVEEGIGSIMAVPIKIRDRIIGSLRVFDAKKRAYHRYEQEYALALAEQCGIAIENAILYSKGKEQYRNLVSEMHNWIEYCAYKPE